MDQQLLEHYKNRLLDMRARLIPTVQNIEQSIVENVRAQGDVSNAPTHMATEDEEGVDEHIALVQNEQGLLEEVEGALARIENGSYGRCGKCGREISQERLDALPHTRWCIECARQEDQTSPVEP